MNIKNIFNHFKTICIHKRWVFHYCFKAGIPWRGIKHDMSKFSPTEFIESIKFYTGTDSPINKCKKENGYSKAWQHHKGRNTHHYEYWTDNYDSGTTFIIMPFKDSVEMICDYLAAARAYMGKNFTFEKEYNWWKVKREHCAMHPMTKRFVNIIFKMMYEFPNGNYILDKYVLWDIYNLVNFCNSFTDEMIISYAVKTNQIYSCHTDELKYPIRTTWFCFIWMITHPYKKYLTTTDRIASLRTELINKFGEDFE